MAMLNYDAEIRKPADIDREITKASTTPRKLRLAEELVGKWQDGQFDFSDYKDHYRQKVKKAIEAKKKGVELDIPEEEEPQVINLMDALQRSVAAGSKGNTRHAHNGKSKTTKRNSHTAHRRRA
jgi:non-homologous end joining protein Ku